MDGFLENIGFHLSLAETALCIGELNIRFTTNKSAKDMKGCLVEMVKRVKTEAVIESIENLSAAKRNGVKEVTLDMASTVRKISINCFPNAQRVIDRFHVQKLAIETL